MRRSSCSVAFALLLLTAASGDAADVKGSNDHELVPQRFEGAAIIQYKADAFDEYELVTTVPDKPKPTQTQHLEGKVTRIVYAIPKGVSTLQVLRNYETVLGEQGFATIFTCGSGTCGYGGGKYINYFVSERAGAGQSFLWHSDVRYLAAKRAHESGDAYVSLLLSQDDSAGARRGTIFALLEVIEMKPMAATMVKVDAAAMEKDITQTGRVTLYGIYFDFDKADVKPESRDTLVEIATLVSKDPKLKLFVVGHTDGKGSPDYNQGLSQRRAESVVRELTSAHGVAAGRLRGVGVGMYAPVAPNTTEEGRAKNRRVELVAQGAGE